MCNSVPLNHNALCLEWHQELNHRHFSSITSGSNIKAWWICSENHEWQATIKNRFKGNQCPYCSNKKVLKGFNDLATTHAGLAGEWHPTKNEDILPTEVSKGYGKKIWWICAEGHEWEATPNTRTYYKTKCPVCTGVQIIEGINDFKTKLPEMYKEWHPTKNASQEISNMGTGYRKEKSWWICSQGHEWQETIKNRSTRKNGCMQCSGQKLNVGVNSLAVLSPELAKQWHPSLNNLTPEKIKNSSKKKAWWICPEGHEWEARLNSRSISGNGCPVCSSRIVLVGFNDLISHIPELIYEWNFVKNDFSPFDVTPQSNRKAWWICPEGHEWEAAIYNRAAGKGCQSCNSGGFSPAKSSKFYLLNNIYMQARKIGITNNDSSRLAKWEANGWEIMYIEECESGTKIQELEKRIKTSLKIEHNMIPELGPKDMHGMGGWTETFSINGITNEQLIKNIKEEWLKIKRGNTLPD